MILDFGKLKIHVVICSVTTKSSERLYNNQTNREEEMEYFLKHSFQKVQKERKKKQNRWNKWKVFSKMEYLNSNTSIIALKVN